MFTEKQKVMLSRSRVYLGQEFSVYDPNKNKMFFKMHIPKEKNDVLKIFKTQEFGEVRTVILNGKMWFVAQDIVRVMGYSNTNTINILREHCDGIRPRDMSGVSKYSKYTPPTIMTGVELKDQMTFDPDDPQYKTDTEIPITSGHSTILVIPEIIQKDNKKSVSDLSDQPEIDTNDKVFRLHDIYSGDRWRRVSIIDEADMYRLIFSSKKQDAKTFQNWVFEVVLPTINSIGTFSLENLFPNLQSYRHFGESVSIQRFIEMYDLDMDELIHHLYSYRLIETEVFNREKFNKFRWSVTAEASGIGWHENPPKKWDGKGCKYGKPMVRPDLLCEVLQYPVLHKIVSVIDQSKMMNFKTSGLFNDYSNGVVKHANTN